MPQQLPDWIQFWQRPFPSGNVTLLQGKKPLLVDSGYGSDIEATVDWLQQMGTPPNDLDWLINIHYHADHVGGNHHLQTHYGVQIAAHRWEGLMLNQGNREACSADYLDQDVAPYQVNWLLEGNEILAFDERRIEVIHTPGHSLGHISLYLPDEQILLCGDVLQAKDVAWLNPFREGAGALQQTIVTLNQLAKLDIKLAIPGHGPLIEDVPATLTRALKRYEQWLAHPEKLSWHACKRIFAYKLMINNGLQKDEVEPYLLTCPWFQDYSQHSFRQSPADFIEPFLAEILRSGAARWQGDLLVAGMRYNKPREGWNRKRLRPY
ncbi:MAG: MBL fold metallo-hydrolase [Chloroflexota bacterium]